MEERPFSKRFYDVSSPSCVANSFLNWILYVDDDDDGENVDDDDDEDIYLYRIPQPDPSVDTSRVEEIPAKEPRFNAMPLKSALKKKGSGSGPGTPQNTPTQEMRPLTVRQTQTDHNASFK